MSKHAKTIQLVEAARGILDEYHPMTVRQVYYQLVSRQVIENNRSQYQAVSNALVDARQDGRIPWEWIEDRLRLPHTVGMWDDLADFSETAIHAYRRDTWATQPGYLECWLEKDALSGLFESVLRPYGVTLNVGRGYDGWSSLYNAAGRFADYVGEETPGTSDFLDKALEALFTEKGDMQAFADSMNQDAAEEEKHDRGTILYYGDLDPSGEDMVRSLRERLAFFRCRPKIIKCALTLEDMKAYNLPPALAKKTDTRRAAFVEKFGDICVELDALPAAVLQSRLKNDVETRLDLDALELVKLKEKCDKEKLRELLGGEA